MTVPDPITLGSTAIDADRLAQLLVDRDAVLAYLLDLAESSEITYQEVSAAVLRFVRREGEQ